VCASRERADEAEEALEREAGRSPAFAELVGRAAARLERLSAGLRPPPDAFEPGRLRAGEHVRLSGELAA
jgi:hypothetical protein